MRVYRLAWPGDSGASRRTDRGSESVRGLLLVYLIGCVGLQIWSGRSLIARVRTGRITKWRAAGRYAGWSFLPVLVFVAGFAVLVGIEESFDLAIIDERTALLGLPVIGLSTVGTVAFWIVCAVVRPTDRR